MSASELCVRTHATVINVVRGREVAAGSDGSSVCCRLSL